MSNTLVSGIPNGIEQLSLDEGGAVGILQHLQKDELQSLLGDDSKLEQLIQDSEVVRQIKQTKQVLAVHNKSLAEYNLSQEERLIQSRNFLAETYAQVECLLQQLKKKKFMLESHGSQASLDTLLALLETEAAKTEENSEMLCEQLLQKEIEAVKFVDSYLAIRAQMYQQKIKADKLFEIIYQAS